MEPDHFAQPLAREVRHGTHLLTPVPLRAEARDRWLALREDCQPQEALP